MRIEQLISRQTNCISCSEPAACACTASESCIRINRDCNTCSLNVCVPLSTSSPSNKGPSKGALAGGVVGALLFFSLAIGLFIWFRKRLRANKFAQGKPELPAPAETVLNRPDPTEKPATPTELNTVRVYSSVSNTTIDLDPESRHSSTTHTSRYNSSHGSLHSNPFDDGNSIQTAGTEGTNVIPIALVSPDIQAEAGSRHSSTSPSLSMRPVRSPDMILGPESSKVLQPIPTVAQSTISVISGISSRNSFMSNASYTSDFLNEAPMIITPTNSSVRHVVGVVKAEVINAGSLSPGLGSLEKIRTNHLSAKPSIKSPLATSSFGPSDVIPESDESSFSNPFTDKYGPLGNASRPSSVYTQPGSVIDIGSATRFNVGLSNLSSSSSQGTTVGRLVSPNLGVPGTLQEQQQLALAHAQAQAFGMDKRRISGSSVLSGVSTRADSILEAFPFVPPSPISDRPLRSPVPSPLAQQSFSHTTPSPLAQHTITLVPPSPQVKEELPTPTRQTLGLSTASQFSTASSGLGSFPFQIDHGMMPDINHLQCAPSEVNGRVRASLDTLAITSDLSSYPLGLEENRLTPPMPPTKGN